MELRSIKAFAAVVHEGGFSRAAKKLHVTQSTVSKAVKQLEDELKTPFFDRGTHPHKLTDAGQRAYKKSLAILRESEALEAEMSELRGLKKGVLRLGLPAIGSSLVFARWFALYRRRFPGVTIHLVEGGSKDLEAMTLAGELDLATSLLPVSEAFAWQELRREPIDVLLPAGHALAGRRQLSLRELESERFILFPPGFALHRMVLDACRQAGFEPEIAAQSSQIDFVMELVAASMGVALIPRVLARQKPGSGTQSVALKDPRLYWHLALIWRRDGYLSEAAKSWLELGANKKLIA